MNKHSKTLSLILTTSLSVIMLCQIIWGDDYDGILLTGNQDIAQERADELAYEEPLPLSMSSLYGTWVAPDGGKWYFQENGYMGDTGRHMGCSFYLQDDTLSFSGPLGNETYSIKLAADNNQLFLFDKADGDCVLALDRLHLMSGGVNDLEGAADGSPLGALDEVGAGPGVVYTGGWTFDPDTPAISSELYVCIGGTIGTGELYGPYTADLIRDALDEIFGVGRYHAFATAVYTQLSGPQTIYIYTTDYPSGNLILLGHSQIDIPARVLSVAETSQTERIDKVEFETESESKATEPVTEAANIYSAEEAASILHGYCHTRTSENGISYIMDEGLEGEHVYALWWRSYTSFTSKFSVDLTSGDVTVSGPYNGTVPDSTLPFSEEYAFNLAEYEQYRFFDEYQEDNGTVKVD